MVLLSFLAALVLSIAGMTVAVVRGLGLWRQTKRTGGLIGAQLSSFEERAQLAQRHLESFERSNADLQRAVERLQHSRARLQVLLRALERSRARVRWLRVFLPR